MLTLLLKAKQKCLIKLLPLVVWVIDIPSILVVNLIIIYNLRQFLIINSFLLILSIYLLQRRCFYSRYKHFAYNKQLFTLYLTVVNTLIINFAALLPSLLS